MRNYFLNKTIVTITALVLLYGCTATSDETAVADECVIAPPGEPIACTMQYDPVCGCDGKTYGNACMARGAGVPRTTPGACEQNTSE